MSKLFMLWHRPAIVDSVFTYFLKLGEDCRSKKELPEGIYNYETV